MTASVPAEGQQHAGTPVEIPDFIRRAIEAQGVTTPDEVQAALERGDYEAPEEVVVQPPRVEQTVIDGIPEPDRESGYGLKR